MSDEQPLIKVEDLVIRFPVKQSGQRGYLTPVDHISFEIAAGEVLSLVGESGSGKTTLGRALLRLNTPASGRIEVDGRDVTQVRSRRALNQLRRDAQMIFQDPFGSLNPVRTVGQHLKVIVQKHHGLRGEGAQDYMVRLLETVGLTPGREVIGKYPHEMSGGQRQRVAIARALAVNPKFIVADEPISMLDVSIRAEILKLLNHLKSEFHLAYLYITHDLASANYFGDRMMILYGGKVMETGTSKQVVGQPMHPYTRLLLSSTAGSSLDADWEETSIESPNLFDHRTGCPYAHRCPLVSDVCRQVAPPLTELEPQHHVACHHAVS
jgi:peptide/nickel transport system ATP-binding protein